jgi:hypothetical protein
MHQERKKRIGEKEKSYSSLLEPPSVGGPLAVKNLLYCTFYVLVAAESLALTHEHS